MLVQQPAPLINSPGADVSAAQVRIEHDLEIRH
jgi:hypothetical protein